MAENRRPNGQFMPGAVSNPHGRPKLPEELKLTIRKACPEAVNVLISLLSSKKEMIRLKAAQELLDRGYGKPESMSKVELTGASDNAIVFRWVNESSTEQSLKAGNEKASERTFPE